MVKQLMERVRAGDRSKPLDLTLQAFQITVNNDLIPQPLSENMFTEVPTVSPYDNDPGINLEVLSFEQMLTALNLILTKSPMPNFLS